AVLAFEPTLRAQPHKSAVAVATVVLFGTLSMFLYPVLYHAGWLPFDTQSLGIYIGGTIHEVAQVVGAASNIDPATTARVPIFLSRDDRYFQDTYQGMPLEGYTPMFQRILAHPNIEVELETDALKRLDVSGAVLQVDGAPFDGPVIYTGQADELFGFRYGPLPYRTLDFRVETLHRDDFQGYGTVNYTVDQEYTRITEFKHLTGQDIPGTTTIVKEYSRAYSGIFGEIPYYAVMNPANNAQYERYKTLADRFGTLHLLGRLAEYKYYNMDAIAARALELAETLAR
ncbi:MAG: putative sulfate exporter family transporter, partial [Lawsonibacter sp.]